MAVTVTPAAPAPTPEVTVTNVAPNAAVTVTDEVIPADTTPKMPDGGSEKFWDGTKGEYNWEGDAKEKAWQLAQKPNVAATPPKEPVQPKSADPATTPAAIIAEPAATAAAAGVDVAAFNAYVAEHGEVSPEHLEQFKTAGIDPAIVTDYANMKLEQAAAHVEGVQDFLGGDHGITQLKTYMGANYTEAEVGAFEKQLLDPGTWKATASMLLAQAGLAPGTSSGLHQGPNQSAPSTGGTKFNSEAEFNTALRDPRYKSDPAFRKQVEDNLRNSMNSMSAGPKHTG